MPISRLPPAVKTQPWGSSLLSWRRQKKPYTLSFKTYQLNTPEKKTAPTADVTVSQLQSEFADLDQKLEEALAAIPEADVDKLVIERESGIHLSPRVQLQAYEESLFIFYGKVMVYLKAMGRPRTPEWEKWVG